MLWPGAADWVWGGSWYLYNRGLEITKREKGVEREKRKGVQAVKMWLGVLTRQLVML